jgi:hypothetical protein
LPPELEPAFRIVDDRYSVELTSEAVKLVQSANMDSEAAFERCEEGDGFAEGEGAEGNVVEGVRIKCSTGASYESASGESESEKRLLGD